MKVKTLIELLQKFDGELYVYGFSDDEGNDIANLYSPNLRYCDSDPSNGLRIDDLVPEYEEGEEDWEGNIPESEEEFLDGYGGKDNLYKVVML